AMLSLTRPDLTNSRYASPHKPAELTPQTNTPPRPRAGKHSAPAPPRRSPDEPHQDRKGNQAQRPNIRRRQRQRRGRAGEKRDENTPPSLGQHDRMGEALERHGRADLDGAVSEERRSASSPPVRRHEGDPLSTPAPAPPC